MSSSALLVPSRSLDAQAVEGMLSPRGCLAAELADCFSKSPRASLAEHFLKPQLVSPRADQQLDSSRSSTRHPVCLPHAANRPPALCVVCMHAHAQSAGTPARKSFSGDTVLGEPEPGSDAAALSKLRGHWLLPAVGKPAAAAVLADLKVQRIADGEWLQGPWQQQ